MQENFAKEIEQAMNRDLEGLSDTPSGRPTPLSQIKHPAQPTETLLPDGARSQIEQATRALRVLGEDAKLLAGVLEHIQQACGKMQDNLALARKAIDAASKRL
jgi:hypothetical protein